MESEQTDLYSKLYKAVSLLPAYCILTLKFYFLFLQYSLFKIQKLKKSKMETDVWERGWFDNLISPFVIKR